MLDVYLIRHGESTWNVERRLQGCCMPGPGLSELGRRQSTEILSELVNAAQEEHIVVYTSPLRRCLETVEGMKSSLPGRVHVIVDDGLKERDMGAVCTGSVISREMMEGIRRGRYPDVESFEDLMDRAFGVMTRIVCESQKMPGERRQRIFVVSHGGWLSALVRRLSPNRKYPPMSNGAVSHVSVFSGSGSGSWERSSSLQWCVHSWNTTSTTTTNAASCFGGSEFG
jgi:broad specificity phosphatase PhoE